MGSSRHAAGNSFPTRKSKRSGNGTVCESSVHAAGADDLATILQYIDEHSPRGAENVKRAIRKTIELVGEFPEGGRLAGEEAIRVLPVGGYPYLIYWTFEAGENLGCSHSPCATATVGGEHLTSGPRPAGRSSLPRSPTAPAPPCAAAVSKGRHAGRYRPARDRSDQPTAVAPSVGTRPNPPILVYCRVLFWPQKNRAVSQRKSPATYLAARTPHALSKT
jgi:plasmid stabilization system protein ParE